MTGHFVGVDVGGTFTDVVLGDPDGALIVTKVATTPDDPRDGVAAGVAELLATGRIDPAAVTRVVHGTTLATNVVLERRGSDVAFVTTEGFGDMLRLGREFRQEDERFDLFFRTPAPPVLHSRTFEVRERVDARGAVLIELDDAEAGAVAGRVAASGATGVAVCFLHAYAHPEHEQRVAAACRAALPAGAYVATSSDVWPELREYERAMTTVMCAYVGPLMAQYLAGLEERLASLGIRCPVEIMESSGGVMSAALAARRPIYTVESGGAAGVIAAGFVGRLIGANDVISFDMGGTTAKTGVVRGGQPDVTHNFHVGGVSSAGRYRPGSGFPIKIPVVDMAEVGAGGGSIAVVDAGGGLRVGPHSAGSVPGPACYGRGGTDATVTDANLVLGYLRPGELSGGVAASPELARKAVERAVGGPLGLDPLAAARAVHDVANAAMAAAIRVVTVQRGIDPRDFTLVAFGGAGPMHAAELADLFGIDHVVVPRAAGVASALGLIASDLSVERARTHLMQDESADPAQIGTVFDELERQAASELPQATGALLVTRSVDVRYRGQAHQLTVPAPSGPVSADSVGSIKATFREYYQRSYGIELDAPIELVNFRVRVVQTVDKFRPLAQPVAGRDPGASRIGTRRVWFDVEVDGSTCEVHGWELLEPGARLDGPVIVEGPDTTVVAPPGFTLHVDEWRNLVLRRSG